MRSKPIKKKKRVQPTYQDRVTLLIAATQPLLELFSVVNEVFEQPDAFSKSKVSLGRIYENWKKARKYFDPEFNAHRYQFPEEDIPRVRSVTRKNRDGVLERTQGGTAKYRSSSKRQGLHRGKNIRDS